MSHILTGAILSLALIVLGGASPLQSAQESNLKGFLEERADLGWIIGGNSDMSNLCHCCFLLSWLRSGWT